MSLVVEDGSGLANAESYASVAAVVAYFQKRNIDLSGIATATMEGYLRLATDYMVGYYREQWKGYRCGFTQALDWPRNGVELTDITGGFRGRYTGNWPYLVPNNIVPVPVVNACCILAYKASQADANDLMPDITRDSGPKVEKVDVIETVFDTSLPIYTLFRSADLQLSAYLTSFGGAGVSLVRS